MTTAELIEVSPERSMRGLADWIDRIPAISTGIALLVGVLLRCMQLGTRSLWFDEGYTAWAIDRPFGEIIRVIRADTAPPLYYLILHQWAVLFGRSEAALRSLSALFATLTLFVFVALARRVLKNPWAVTAAVWLFSLSFMQIAYAHEARFYAMMAFLGAIDLYVVLLLCERSSVPRLTAAVLFWTASLYTNNVMAIYLAALAGAWLIAPGACSIWRRIADLTGVSIVSGLAFAPWLPALRAQMVAVRGHFWPEVPDAAAFGQTLEVMTGLHAPSLGLPSANAVIVIGVGLCWFLVATLRTRRQAAMVAALMLFGVLPILFVFVYSHFAQSIYMDRAFLVSSVTLPLLATLPLTAHIYRGARRIAVVAGVLGLIVFASRSLPMEWLGTQEENWRAAMKFAVQTPAKHRLMVFVANEGELFYDYYVRGSDYSRRSDLVGVPSSFFALDPPRTMRHVECDDDLKDLKNLLVTEHYDQIVFVSSHSWFADPPLRTFNLLNRTLPLIDKKTISRLTVFRFGAPVELCMPKK